MRSRYEALLRNAGREAPLGDRIGKGGKFGASCPRSRASPTLGTRVGGRIGNWNWSFTHRPSLAWQQPHSPQLVRNWFVAEVLRISFDRVADRALPVRSR